ncbi:transcriptional regulator, AbrB family [Thermodesulfatator indicus DSM 15286]|uniref:Transcriptional regulator, AbrB family n=1 Tax=Thermodesulfatator indicus (strain DSM 15286 / JCM 11887 / CIR29812) TaxID=667014 RepID=F8AC46_THEID|nr:AbrB/MazE/SpoVT family DNA-binding domain-containing protein [Thermodesulfatator indicus]AEH44601.1 transcriptional regulator, AbrB family [Thermodesulfatator indicus DSM 15286]
MRVKVAERGQVTIPKVLRERLGIRPGTILEFREKNGYLIATKIEPLDPVDRAYGKFGRGRRTDEIMKQLREYTDDNSC